MHPTQRHLTALTALAMLLMAVSVGCASAKGSSVTLTGVEGSAGETSTPGPDDASAIAPTVPVPAEAAAGGQAPVAADVQAKSEASSESVGGSGSFEPPTTTRSVTRSQPGADDALDIVEGSLAESDICGVYIGLAKLEIDGISTERFAAQLRRIRDIMIGAEAIAPEGIRDDWTTVADATADVVEALEDDPGSMSSAADSYEDADYLAAQQRVETWMSENCG